MLVQFRERGGQRDALVAHQGEAGARGRRHGAAGDQRDRGRHRAQAGRAGPALPRRGEPRARRLARLRGDAGDDRQAGGPGRRRLVRRRPRRRPPARGPARRGRARRPGQGRARRRSSPSATPPSARTDRGLHQVLAHRRVAAVAAHPGRADRRGGPGRGAPADDPRARDGLGDDRPDAGARPRARRDLVRQRGVGQDVHPGDLRLAEDLALRAATAVENARLYRARSTIAQTLQASLLPPMLPEVPGRRGRRALPARRARTTRSAATSTTSSRPARTTGSRSSATSAARAPRRRP